MALLPDKEKLLRNFLRCANWEEKYLYIIELGPVSYTHLPCWPLNFYAVTRAIFHLPNISNV